MFVIKAFTKLGRILLEFVDAPPCKPKVPQLGSFLSIPQVLKKVQQPQVPQLGLVTPHSYSEGDHGLGVISGLLRKRLPGPLDTQRIKLQKGDPYEGCAKGCFISSFMNACKWHVAIMHICHSFHWFHPSVCCFQCQPWQHSESSTSATGLRHAAQLDISASTRSVPKRFR